MKTKQEIKKWLLENCVDKDGDLFLVGLDFSDFEGNVCITNMKVKKSLFQGGQKVGGCLEQNCQRVGDTLYQSGQVVSGNLYQHSQEVGGNLEQTDLKVKGTIYQNALSNIEIDTQIKALKKVISLLEEQKVNEEGEKKMEDKVLTYKEFKKECKKYLAEYAKNCPVKFHKIPHTKNWYECEFRRGLNVYSIMYKETKKNGYGWLSDRIVFTSKQDIDRCETAEKAFEKTKE